MIELIIGSAILKKGVDKLVDRIFKSDIDKKILSKFELKQAISLYADKYVSEFGSVKILGMNNPIPVTDIYTGVNVANWKFRHDFSNIEQLEKTYIRDGFGGFSEKENNTDAIEVANNSNLLNVLGAPGAGKTTLLKRIGIDALMATDEAIYKHNLIPIFIELKSIKEKNPNLLNIISEYLSDFGFPKEVNVVEVMLNDGAFLFLFDGLDEVEAEYLNGTTASVRKFQNKFDKNRYITSCRTAFYANYFNKFTDVYLLDFDRKQIERFAKNWFNSIGSNGAHHEFISQLRSERNKASNDLARTPLLMTFLCIVYSKTLSFPSNRASLYKKALETLLHDWLAEKQVPIFDAFDGLHVDLEILMLSTLAGPMYEKNSLFFEEKIISDIFKDFLNSELNAPKSIDSKKIIKVIEQKQGVLVERSHGVYSFSHLTIDEYLAAVYFKEFDRVEYLINKWAYSKRWREVFLLLAGMGNADRLILLMAKQCEEILVKHKKLSNVCTWLSKQNEENNKTDEIGLVFERTLEFSKFCQESWVNSGSKQKYFSELLKCFETITKSIVELYNHKNTNISINTNKTNKRKIVREYNSRGLHKDNIISSWSNNELRSAIKYFSIFNLIVECKNASLSMGAKQWSYVVNKFLVSPLNEPNKALHSDGNSASLHHRR